MEQKLTNVKSISIPMEQKEKAINIPRRTFRSAYAERMIASQQITKSQSNFNWLYWLNYLMYPIGFILLVAEIFL